MWHGVEEGTKAMWQLQRFYALKSFRKILFLLSDVFSSSAGDLSKSLLLLSCYGIPQKWHILGSMSQMEKPVGGKILPKLAQPVGLVHDLQWQSHLNALKQKIQQRENAAFSGANCAKIFKNLRHAGGKTQKKWWGPQQFEKASHTVTVSGHNSQELSALASMSLFSVRCSYMPIADWLILRLKRQFWPISNQVQPAFLKNYPCGSVHHKELTNFLGTAEGCRMVQSDTINTWTINKFSIINCNERHKIISVWY